MADSKISALPASTTPLAGTEVLPIVQGSATKQVSVANLTAGRAVATGALTVTGDATLSTGNLVQGTAAKGMNFTANTPLAGMSSQLFKWYEEGTWTPVDGSGASLSLTINAARYTRQGRVIFLYLDVTYPVTADTSAMLIKGLPWDTTISSDGSCSIGFTTYVPATPVFIQISSGLAGVRIQTNGGTTITNAAISAKRVQITGFYLTSS